MKQLRITFALCCWALTAGGQQTTLESKVAKIEIGACRLEDVIKTFGEPDRYLWGPQTFTRDRLPQVYIAGYPNGFSILLAGGVVREIRFEAGGYRYAGRVAVGDPMENLLAVTGPPKRTVKGPMPRNEEPAAGVLYEGGPDGPGYYARPDLGARFFFLNGKVSAIYLTPVVGGKLKAIPTFDPTKPDPFQVDLRGQDLSALDLRDRAGDLWHADFSTRTQWPSPDRLPAGYAPKSILELGSNPGLGVRSLQKRGITGKGVAIAIVDNPLLATHQEYSGRLRMHEYINANPQSNPHFHGSTVVSLAAGKTLGVAPESEIYYISCWAMDGGAIDLTPRAKAVRRFLEVNRTLPPEKRIRVISMSLGWSAGQRGAAEMDAAAKEAKDQGILFVSSSIAQVHGFRFHGLGRDPMADPDNFASYRPGRWWAKSFYDGTAMKDTLLAPMDSRTGAGSGSDDESVYYSDGGWSWTIPYIAGVYALAAQVDHSITPERFWRLALKNGRTIEFTHDGKVYPLGPIVDPVALIRALEPASK